MDTLFNLSQDESLIFKEADKGGALVILNKCDYLEEIP